MSRLYLCLNSSLGMSLVKSMVKVIPMLAYLKLRNFRISVLLPITMKKWTRSNGHLYQVARPLQGLKTRNDYSYNRINWIRQQLTGFPLIGCKFRFPPEICFYNRLSWFFRKTTGFPLIGCKFRSFPDICFYNRFSWFFSKNVRITLNRWYFWNWCIQST